LLDEIARAGPLLSDDAGVRQQLTMGLFNSRVYAKTEDDLARSDALFDELRTLARAFPDDTTVREIATARLD
jgi:hypothetical protein